MNLTRLVALSLLEQGPRHGHEIRRRAELVTVGTWGGISVRSLPRELRQLDDEGLVVAVRTEQVGWRPVRTIYEITDEGRRELHIVREQAISAVHPGPDTLAVALVFADDADTEEILPWLRRRRDAVASEVTTLTAERTRLQTKGYLRPLQAAVMRRAELTMTADVRWHDELLTTLSAHHPNSAPAHHKIARLDETDGPDTDMPRSTP